MYNTEDKVINIYAKEYIQLYRDVDKFVVSCKQCEHYGNCWSCPPFTFDTEKYLSGYENVFIIGTKITSIANLDIRDVFLKERKILDGLLLKIELQYPNSRSFFAGVCHFCDNTKCSRINEKPCRYANSIRPSLEAFGFDIGRTSTELLGIELKWGHEGKSAEYLTLVSAFFTNIKKIEWKR